MRSWAAISWARQATPNQRGYVDACVAALASGTPARMSAPLAPDESDAAVGCAAALLTYAGVRVEVFAATSDARRRVATEFIEVCGDLGHAVVVRRDVYATRLVVGDAACTVRYGDALPRPAIRPGAFAVFAHGVIHPTAWIDAVAPLARDAVLFACTT